VYVDDVALRGQVASASDAKPTPNTVVTYAYDPDDTETDVARPNSAGSFQVTNHEYDRLGAVTAVTDPLGNETAYARDSLLRITSVTPRGLGAVPYELGYYPNSMQLQTATNGAGEVNRRGADTTTATRATRSTRSTRRSAPAAATPSTPPSSRAMRLATCWPVGVGNPDSRLGRTVGCADVVPPVPRGPGARPPPRHQWPGRWL
jgi:YD repeat-containing protein